jgi:hypothetical protein
MKKRKSTKKPPEKSIADQIAAVSKRIAKLAAPKPAAATKSQPAAPESVKVTAADLEKAVFEQDRSKLWLANEDHSHEIAEKNRVAAQQENINRINAARGDCVATCTPPASFTFTEPVPSKTLSKSKVRGISKKPFHVSPVQSLQDRRRQEKELRLDQD